MAWIPIAVWIAAAVVAIVVLGYCGYEIVWKAKRLQRDVGELNRTNEQLTSLGKQLDEFRRRLAASRTD